MRLEGIDGLVDQRHTVGQEQHALGPVGAHQHVDQRDHRARLAGAGGHHHQGLALAVRLKGVTHAAHGALLVVPLDDGPSMPPPASGLAAAAALHQQLQLLLSCETPAPARGG
jgi:hypothetical protein